MVIQGFLTEMVKYHNKLPNTSIEYKLRVQSVLPLPVGQVRLAFKQCGYDYMSVKSKVKTVGNGVRRVVTFNENSACKKCT